MTVQEIVEVVQRDIPFYGKEGGVTLSGGEPALHAEGCLEILKACKSLGLHTTMETCGFFDESLVPALAEDTDLFLWDIKDTDEQRHLAYTGQSNGRILCSLARLDACGGASVLRCIMVKGVNMEPAHYRALADLFLSLKHCQGIELMPYHALGEAKNEQLGYADHGRVDWIPDREEIDTVRECLQTMGCVIMG